MYWRCVLWLIFIGRLRFGRLFFGVNLLTYIGYLVCLSSFIMITYPDTLDSHTGCPVKLMNATVNSSRQVHHYMYILVFVLSVSDSSKPII